MPFVFKCSYDKANRSSGRSFRGLGLQEGLAILNRVRRQLDIPVLTDVHLPEEAFLAAEAVDVLQVPAFLCRQTDLLAACARTGKWVNVKKGQFLSPSETKNIIEKLTAQGARDISLTERGTTFGYQNLVVDMRSLAIMKTSGYPVIFDATHSVQLPGAQGAASGGQREFVEPLARAAAAVGVAGVFMETHPNPDRALSDGPNNVSLAQMPALLKKLVAIDRLVKRF